MCQILTIREYKDADKEIVLALFKANTPKYFAFDEEEDFIHYIEKSI